jgi:hypothetical protein
MNTETQRIIDRLGVKLTAKEVPCIVARKEFSAGRPWRVTLTRKEGRGKDATELKLVVTGLFGTPELKTTIGYLLLDVQSSEQTYWDFSQDYCKGLPTEDIERMHKACKKLAPRVKKFFGTAWGDILRAEQGLPPVARTRPKRVRRLLQKKSA